MRNRACAIIFRDGKLLVIHRHKPDRDYYTVPGGGVEFEESFEEACIREIKEETGFDVITLRLVRKYITLEKEENYFLAQVPMGEPVLGGGEAKRQSLENQYVFEWVDAEQLKKINLLPEAARKICLEVYQDLYK